MGYIFISYSHNDMNYVHQLQALLQSEGFEVWVDDRIDYGDEWPMIIQEKLDGCDAFILVATDDSYKSRWVQKEVTRAQRMNKPFFPLLLGGHPWLAIESTQYVDVRDQSLPPEKFYQRLEGVTNRKKSAGSSLTTETRPSAPRLKLPTEAKPPEPAAKQPPKPEPAPKYGKMPPPQPKRSNGTFLILGAVGVVGTLCICAFLGSAMLNIPLSPAATNTRTSIKTPTVRPTNTPIFTQTPTALPTMVTVSWPINVHDTFDSNSNNWKLGDYDGDLATWNNSIANGILLWNAKAKSGFSGRLTLPDKTDIADFLLAVDGKRLSGPQTATYGLIFRLDENGNYYTFRIAGDEFTFDLRKDDEWSKLIEWTVSSAILPNEKNTLAVLAVGNHFTFYVNDQYVGEFEDSQLTRGSVAMIVSLYRADEQSVFEFDNFILRTP
jgi:hypothetical protein